MDDYKYANEPSIVEEAIIGCLLVNDNLINEFYLQPKHFLNKYNRILISKILDIKNEIGKVDLILLCDKLASDMYLCELAMSYVESLVTPSEFHWYQEKQEEIYKGYMINQIINKYNDKKLDYNDMWLDINKINSECGNNDESSATMLSGTDIFQLITTNRNELKFETYSKLQNRLKLMTNTVNVISARTSQGKSALALNFMNDLAKNYKCLYFNMEMTEKELYQRLVSINSGIEINRFINCSEKNVNEGIWKGIEEVKKRKIKIYNGSKNVKALRTILTKESQKEHCIAFIDYIGYVSSTKSNQNDRERIGEVVREIQNMTKDLDITVFMIAQINRSGEENSEPNLTNLKDSGELEQTAHCVMIIHRVDKDITNQTPEVKLLIPKNRSGELFSWRMTFDKPTQRFLD